MAQCPPTPIATRRAQRHASRPYTTDFRSPIPEESRQDSDELNTVPKHPFSRRSVSFRLSNSPDITSPKFVGYTRSIDGDMSSPSHTDLDSPSLTPKARVQSYYHPSHLLNRAEEIGMREKENYALSSPLVPTLRASGATPASCSTVQSSWISKYLTTPIEEYQLEDDDAADVPPISSSPSRFSDSFFPSHEPLSSPRTSYPDSPVLESKASPVEVTQTVATGDGDFVSNLHALLAVAAQQRALHAEIDNAIASTLEGRSLSVTPDYCPSPTPGYGKDVFGPRIARRAPSYTPSADSAAVEWCDCSDCVTSRSASRTESIASNSTYTGYAADIDSSPAPVFAPQAHSSRALTQFRASAITTQQLIATYSTSASPSPFPSPFKRSSSSLGVDYTTPPSRYRKKSKPISRPLSFPSRSKTETFDNTTLSRVPASLRKSLSLRSCASDRSPPYEDWITTAPHTPTPKEGRLINPARAIPFDVPIIAPPPYHIARLPLSKETAAEIRIMNFLMREAKCWAEDGLDGMTVAAAISTLDAGLDLYEDEGRRELERLRWEHILGIGAKLREEVVRWILDVLPKKSVYFPPIKYASHRLSSGSDRSSSSFSSAHDFGDKGLPDLIEQLLYSPETRFHAAYMFMRYWYLLMGDRESQERIKSMQEAAAAAEDGLPEDPSIPSEGWYLVAWDSCLACLAISVKMHRDFLEPLAPVYSWEFEAMAPHQISYEDLEIAQRDVLEVFDFRLGATPQPILDELWIALPSLQQLLDFKNGWKFAQKETWWRLFDAVAEPDVLKLPISLLTVAALAEALVAALVSKYEYDATVNNPVIRRRPNQDHPESRKHLQKLQTRAEKEMEGVIQDIQAVIGISDQTLKSARTWIRASLKD